MGLAKRALDWIRASKQARGAVRVVRRIALVAWKCLRRVPLVNRLRLRVNVDGHKLLIRAFSYDDLLCANDDYEACLAEVLPPLGGVAVDAGAFIGRHALAYARAVGPSGQVVAVEPLPETFGMLRYNVAFNGYANIHCVDCALGSSDGDAWLSYERETSTASLVRDLPHKLRVAQRTLARVLSERGIRHVDLLKLDVEGAERDVLEGAWPILAASPRPLLVIEIHGNAGPDVADWLTVHGFTLERCRDGQRVFFLARKQEDTKPE
jgi:FkbM family methyltransferase